MTMWTDTVDYKKDMSDPYVISLFGNVVQFLRVIFPFTVQKIGQNVDMVAAFFEFMYVS